MASGKLIEITKEELYKIHDEHQKWLVNPKTGKRADLKNTWLSGGNFDGMNFKHALFSSSCLHWASLKCTNLSECQMVNVNLNFANLQGANLSGVDLSGSTVKEANLEGANLQGSNLTDTNFRQSNLMETDLRKSLKYNADFRLCFLKGARLTHNLVSGDGYCKRYEDETFEVLFFYPDIVHIGCRIMKVDTWRKITEKECIRKENKHTWEWWKNNRAIIYKICSHMKKLDHPISRM